MAIKYQSHEITPPTAYTQIYGADWNAQTFTPAIAHSITLVYLHGYRTGLPGNVTVGIYDVDSSSKPTGTALSSGTFDGNSIPLTGNGLPAGGADWGAAFAVTSYPLLIGTEYAIVISLPGGDSSNKIRISNESVTGYSRGQSWYSGNSGVTWETAASQDYLFQEWGVANFPAEAITRVTNIIHRYNRKEGDYSMEVALGEVTSDFGLPEWLSRPRASIPDTDKQRGIEEMAKSPAIFKTIQEAIDAKFREAGIPAWVPMPGIPFPTFGAQEVSAAEPKTSTFLELLIKELGRWEK